MLDLDSNLFLANVNLPPASGPAGIAANASGSRLYVAAQSTNAIVVVDATGRPPS